MKKQLTLLQVYRGIASLLVVLTHAHIILNRELKQNELLGMFHFGWVGVDFFFVLSGFIIFYVHQSDIGQNNKFKSFIIKRFIRVYPLYWIVLFSKIIATSIAGDGNNISQYNFWEIIKVMLLFPQDRQLLDGFIGVSWTLSYEVFFYSVFALMIIIKPKNIQPILITWVIGILLNIFNLLPIKESFLLTFIFDAHNLEFIFGCLAAYIVSKYKIKNGMLLTYASIAMLTVSIFNTKYLEFDVSGVPSFIAYGIPFMLLIIGSVYIENSKYTQIPKILIYLGNASYSIYLTHCFFLNNIAKVFVKIAEKLNLDLFILSQNNYFTLIIASLIVIITLSMGCFIYYYLEQPLLTKLKKHFISS